MNNSIIVFVDSSVFSKDAILKCLYWYSDKFKVSCELIEDKYYKISLEPNPNLKLEDKELNNYFHKLERDLVDFNLRDIVTKETQNIRDLLIAKAFSHFNTEEKPPGDYSDPVGKSDMQ